MNINDTKHKNYRITMDGIFKNCYFYSVLPWNVIIETEHLVQIEYHQQSSYQTRQVYIRQL